MLKSTIYTDATPLGRNRYLIGYITPDGVIPSQYKVISCKDINIAELESILFAIDNCPIGYTIYSDNLNAVNVCNTTHEDVSIMHCNRLLNIANNYLRAIKEGFS